MKILLDENLPRKLKGFFDNHEVFSVKDMGWSGKTNGELFALLHTHGFHVFITSDKNLRFQVPLSKYTASVILLKADNNRLQTLRQCIPKIISILGFVKPGQVYDVSL